MLIIDTLGNDEVYEIVYGYGSYGFKIGDVFKPIGKAISSVAKVVKKAAPILIPAAAIALPVLAPGLLAAAGSAIGSAATGAFSALGTAATAVGSAVGSAATWVSTAMPSLGTIGKVISPGIQVFRSITSSAEEAPEVASPEIRELQTIRDVQNTYPPGVIQDIVYSTPTWVPTAAAPGITPTVTPTPPVAEQSMEYNQQTNTLTIPKEIMSDMVRRSNAYNRALEAGRKITEAELAGFGEISIGVNNFVEQGYSPEQAAKLELASVIAKNKTEEYTPHILIGSMLLVALMLSKTNKSAILNVR